jgi:uncharacterized DUF497 family protein
MNSQSLNFDWDDANRDHLARHGVKLQEAEEVVLGDPLDIEMQTAEARRTSESDLSVGRAEATQDVLPSRNEATLWEH